MKGVCVERLCETKVIYTPHDVNEYIPVRIAAAQPEGNLPPGADHPGPDLDQP